MENNWIDLRMNVTFRAS